MISTSVTIAAIVLCGAIAYRTAKAITKPLADTVGVLRNIAEGEGDLTRRVNQNTGDELGEMGKWVNTFMVKLEGLVARNELFEAQLPDEVQHVRYIGGFGEMFWV